jgi:hypothetical protein
MKAKDCEKLDTVLAAPVDFMAKRKLNTAPRTIPNITLDTIERDGLTLESLSGVNVPVYKYRTQITIHGLWPETDGYCFGYKNLVQNKNGSFGVRYAAIDGRKKRTIRNISRHGDFYPNHDSQGTTFTKGYKQDVTALKADFELIRANSHLYIGYANILKCMLSGRLYIQIALKAIPKKNIWAFCENILGITKSDYYTAARAELAKDRARKLERQQERDRDALIKKELTASAITDLESAGLSRFTPNGNAFRGYKPNCGVHYTGERYTKYTVCETKRKGPNMCIMSKSGSDLAAVMAYEFDWKRKARKYDGYIKALWI